MSDIHQYEKMKNDYLSQTLAKIPPDLEELREDISAFQLYPELSGLGLPWSHRNNEFLSLVGLPCSAPSMLEFRSPQNLNHPYIHIGFNNYGDMICIDTKTGEIVYINHDRDHEVCYMNADPICLFLSICAFAHMMQGDSGYLEELQNIDQRAALPGNWWYQEFVNWKACQK